MSSKRIVSVVCASLLCVGLQPMASSQAKASEEPPGSCNLNVIDPITVSEGKVPVILVHGYTGHPRDWLKNKIIDRINDLSEAEVAQTFDYNKLGTRAINPVYFNGTSLKLAQTIHCVSYKSRQVGGNGKVVLVGYSLGAMLAHSASARKVSGKEISTMVDQVITIADPWKGAFFKDKISLPTGLLGKEPFAPSIHVFKIAGRYSKTIYTHTASGRVTSTRSPSNPDNDTDNLVLAKSALDGYSAGLGGGNLAVDCGNIIHKYPNGRITEKDFGGTFCLHENLLKGEKVRDAIVSVVQAASIRASGGATGKAIRNLTLVRNNSMTFRGKSRWADGSKEQIVFIDRSVWGPNGGKRYSERGELAIEYRKAWVGNKNPLLDSGATRLARVNSLRGDAPLNNIGGAKPTKAGWLSADEAVWYFADKGIAIYATGDYSAAGFKFSAAYYALRSMKWTK